MIAVEPPGGQIAVDDIRVCRVRPGAIRTRRGGRGDGELAAIRRVQHHLCERDPLFRRASAAVATAQDVSEDDLVHVAQWRRW